MLEWLKRHAWKACIRLKRIAGSNPALSAKGKVPEWSIGPHSKCGERVTVPRVRIPVFPLCVGYHDRKRKY